jgi:hypothetical protein
MLLSTNHPEKNIKYQVSWFDNKGPYGHHNDNTLVGIVKEMNQHFGLHYAPGPAPAPSVLFPESLSWITAQL